MGGRCGGGQQLATGVDSGDANASAIEETRSREAKFASINAMENDGVEWKCVTATLSSVSASSVKS